MKRLLVSWTASVLLGLGLASPALGQARPGDPNTTAETAERGPTALPYAMAFFMTVLIMLILCMPTRKRQAP
jgi:hypothetical protein